jgi:nickel-dependent lactate racemase
MIPVIDAVDDVLDAGFARPFFRDKRVAIAVPDLTRPVDYESVLLPLLAALDGVASEVTVVVALGLHRRLNDIEIAPLVSLARRFRAEVVQHDANADDLVEMAADIADDDESGEHADWPTLPSRFARTIAEADRVICVGVVEPHQYAGFSGGAKTVAIGCGSHETISAMHGLEFLRDERTALGRVDDNPFQQALWDLVRPLGPMWGLMVVPHVSSDGSTKECHAARFGPLYAAFSGCVDVARDVFFEEFDEPCDWLHLPVDGPKAVNFYQASRAATYAALVDRPAIREGGLLIVEAACPEGIGEGEGELACAEAMLRGKDVLLEELRGEREIEGEARGGQQRAYVLARALEWCDVALVRSEAVRPTSNGAEPMDELEAMGIGQFGTVEEALEAFSPGEVGRKVEDVFHGVPRVGF